ncbi:MAG: dynamin family protein [Desulfovermiculus sp.]
MGDEDRKRARILDSSFWLSLKVPELTDKSRDLRDLAQGISKKAQVLRTKSSSRALWMVFLGGTGTGKSTLFNAFCGQEVSRTGVERPQTLGAVAYAHAQAGDRESLPEFLGPVQREEFFSAHKGQRGQEQKMTLVVHQDFRLQNLVFVDTPDLDSLVTGHHDLARDILLMADVVFFVASQEKYADEVLYQSLVSLGQSGQKFFFILNKADPPPGRSIQDILEEVVQTLDPKRAFLSPEHSVVLPFVPAGNNAGANADMRAFAQEVTRFYTSGRGQKIVEEEKKRTWSELKADLSRMHAVLQAESREVAAWEKRLQTVYDECVSRLLQREEAGFQSTQRRAVQEEIRKVFGRFDFLAGPRRIISGCLRLPLRLVGVAGPSRKARQEDLERAKRKADSRPVQEAVDEFNALFLERVVPVDRDTPAGRALRRSELAMGSEEVQVRFQAVQDEMAVWLNARFERMAREAPKGKAWGIYSTSALWGVMIVSFETVVGGGLSLVEVLIDSAIAPYVTKGAVELFAYQELRTITRELSARLKEGIVGILAEQKDRYVQAMHELGPDTKVMQEVEEWAGWSEKKALAVLEG